MKDKIYYESFLYRNTYLGYRWVPYLNAFDDAGVAHIRQVAERFHPAVPIRIFRKENHGALVYEDLKGHVELLEEEVKDNE